MKKKKKKDTNTTEISDTQPWGWCGVMWLSVVMNRMLEEREIKVRIAVVALFPLECGIVKWVFRPIQNQDCVSPLTAAPAWIDSQSHDAGKNSFILNRLDLI